MLPARAQRPLFFHHRSMARSLSVVAKRGGEEARRRSDGPPRNHRRRSHRRGCGGAGARRRRQAASRRSLDHLRAEAEGSEAQLDLILAEDNAALIDRNAARENLSRYDRTLEVIADRLAARFSAWYELFPRSQSATANRHGTFDDVIRRLPYVRISASTCSTSPPIHPIGRTNRKGKNNSLNAEPGDRRQRLRHRLGGGRP